MMPDQSDDAPTPAKSQGESVSPDHHAESPNPRDETGTHPQKTQIPFYKRPLLMGWLILAAVVVGCGAVGWWLYARQFESTDDAFIDGHIVQIAPKVSGYVAKLFVDDNDFVHAGDLLVEIDPRDFKVALADTQAALASAEGTLAQARARVDADIAEAAASEAEVTANQATSENAARDYERNSRLSPRSVSKQTLDSSDALAASTRAEELAAKARAVSAAENVKLAKSQLASAQANVDQAQVKVEQAKLNLSYTEIVAPINGRVTHRTVELGNYLEPGQPLFAVVDPNVWVTANFKETQLDDMHPGQRVRVSIDAYPDRALEAHVDSFQRGTGSRFSALPPENATGNYVKVVQRVPVKIVFDEPIPNQMVLGPGMSVVPTVKLNSSRPNGIASTASVIQPANSNAQEGIARPAAAN